MALDFPNSPSDGQYYEGFTWDATYSVWRVRAGFEGRAGIASTTGAAGTATTGEAYIFTGSGAITVSKAGLLDVLIIGGGGGGATGGGGAGGYWEKTLWFEAGSHTVGIGAGGTAGYTRTSGSGSGPADGFNGGDSYVGDYVSPGGGGGAAFRSQASSSNNYVPGKGRTGGSGGGGGQTNYANTGDTQGTAITGFGNAGGQGGFLTGGGGGGAGQVGEDAGADYPAGSEGGNGSISTIISSTDATSFSVGQVSGSDVYYSGGGGGSQYSGAAGEGGLGGGGASNGAGTANTGGGGGTTGGSGVVIVRVS
tara:strand:- start:1135 stop:2061 length:927 start_codon:yes stop_codon:yes gene_type:complete